MTNKKLAETLTGIARPSWLRSVLNEAPQPRQAAQAQPAPEEEPPPEEEAPPEEAPPEEAPPEGEAPPEEAPPEGAPAAAPPDQGAAPPAPAQGEPQPEQPPVGGNQADPSEQPTPPVRPFQNDGLDKLNVDGTPKTSPNRYRQPGPGDQETIKRFLKKNPKATDDDLHSFMRSMGIDPQEGEKTVMKLASKSRDESVSPAIRSAVGLFLGERECDSKGTNKPWRTSGGPKKFAVCASDGGEKKLVRFGDPNMEIKRDSPERRKNFRARHGCATPGPKTKAKYWACKTWEGKKKVSDVVESLVGLFLNERKDLVPGGKGDKLDEKDVDQHELAMGIKVELEHTKSKALAKEIALDHLKEDPKYYSKLKKIHKESEDGPWRRPDIDSDGPGGEFNEVAERAKDLGIPHADLANAIRAGKIAPLGHEHWSQLQNTDSWKTDTHEKAKKRAEKYGKDYSRVVNQITSGAADAPMVLHRPGKPPYLIGGNTRLMAARAMGVTPHVVHAFLGKKGKTESLDSGRQIITDDAPEPAGVAGEDDNDDPLATFLRHLNTSVVRYEGAEGDDKCRMTCGVYIPLPFDLARQFPRMLGGGKNADYSVPHVTVLFVGALSPAEYTGMISVVQEVIARYQPFFMDMFGADVFDDKKDYDTLYAAVTSRTHRALDGYVYPTINVLHAELRKALEDAGLKVEHDYGAKGGRGSAAERYLPHATIARVPKGEQCLVRPPSGSWFVLDVECWGYEKVQLQLGKTVMDQPAFRR